MKLDKRDKLGEKHEDLSGKNSPGASASIEKRDGKNVSNERLPDPALPDVPKEVNGGKDEKRTYPPARGVPPTLRTHTR